MSGTTIRPDAGEQSAFQEAGIACPGERPWLGEGAEEACDQPLVGALINQTNLYFPKTISAILLPDLNQKDDAVMRVRSEIEQDGMTCGLAKTAWSANRRSSAVAVVQDLFAQRSLECTDDQIMEALESIFSPSGALTADAKGPARPESDLLEFRRAEFNILRREVNDPDLIPNLRVIPTSVSAALRPWIERVHLVERLRETRVFYGFDRLEPSPQPLAGMPDSAMKQLFRFPPQHVHDRWLPAVEVFGEGIYLELKESCLSNWQRDNAGWLSERLSDAFVTRLAGAFTTLPPLGAPDRAWASRYLTVHTLAHFLMNQLVFECGYGSASLRERLYVSDDPVSPMAGILIYTAAGDSEGTLGGLVRLGREERLGPLIRRALSRASWCSADPVCSENLGGQGSRLANLAACHACALLPETACETINHGLDRAMIVGLPGNRSVGIMASLVDQGFDLVG